MMRMMTMRRRKMMTKRWMLMIPRCCTMSVSLTIKYSLVSTRQVPFVILKITIQILKELAPSL